MLKMVLEYIYIYISLYIFTPIYQWPSVVAKSSSPMEHLGQVFLPKPSLEAYDKEERTERSTEDYVSTGPKEPMDGWTRDFSRGKT